MKGLTHAGGNHQKLVIPHSIVDTVAKHTACRPQSSWGNLCNVCPLAIALLYCSMYDVAPDALGQVLAPLLLSFLRQLTQELTP